MPRRLACADSTRKSPFVEPVKEMLHSRAARAPPRVVLAEPTQSPPDAGTLIPARPKMGERRVTPGQNPPSKNLPDRPRARFGEKCDPASPVSATASSAASR